MSNTVGVAVPALVAVASWFGWRLHTRNRKSHQQQQEWKAAAQVPTFRVLALGPQGAGKTLLLASMYHNLQTPHGRGYFLTAPYDQVITLNSWFADVADPGRGWPYGTAVGEAREFSFEITTRAATETHPILRIGYLEYAGELLTDPQAPGSTAQQDLIQRIESAHALLGIIDGYRIRQVLDGNTEGQWRLQQALTAMIAPMMRVFSPITFVITKWDLLADVHPDENTRLGIVRNLLLSNPGFRDLVRTHSARRVVRLVPVSAVGANFATLDAGGLITKLPNGKVEPTNVDVPLSSVVPDVFEQIERSLDEATRAAMIAEARRQAQLTPAQAVKALAAFAGQVAGGALLGTLGLRGLPAFASDVSIGLFLDSRGGGPLAERRAALNNSLTEAERRLEQLHRARRGVLRELQGRVDMLEGRLPASRLSGEW
jgi:hypothetical protein